MNTKERYFQIWDDRQAQRRWHLSGPIDSQVRELDPWQFKQGRVLSLTDAPTFRLMRPGDALEFTLAGYAIPLVHARVVTLLETLGLQSEVQFIPARVEGRTENYFILNALQAIRCIDDARCEEVLYWLPEDERPDKVGQYRNVVGMRIDPEKVGGANIFRPWGWRVALIVSERVKLAMEGEGITGPKFTEV